MTIENATTVMASPMQSKSERPEYKAMLEHYSAEQLNFKQFSENHNRNENLIPLPHPSHEGCSPCH